MWGLLHKEFASRRLNRLNLRREYSFSPASGQIEAPDRFATDDNPV
jgi:hypothetical protein